MFTLASKAMVSPSSDSDLALSTYSFDATPFISGALFGGTVTWTGGKTPYTVQLLSGGSSQGQATGIYTKTYTLRIGSINAWNGTVMALRVTDSLGAVITTPGQTVSVYWTPTVSVSVNSQTPPRGSFSTITAAIGSGNPASYSYQWYYRSRINSGGMWSNWTAFAGNANPVYSSTYTTTGQQWEFYCTVISAAGTVSSCSPTVTVGP